MPPFLSSPFIEVTALDLQDAVDTYLAANPLDLTAHTSAADPHPGYQLESQRGVANGYAPLDGAALVPVDRIPASIPRDTEVLGYVTTHTAADDPHADRAFATAAIATHTADTTNVHGIADTSVLETTSGSAAKVTAHSADTTDVHGIPNTSDLVTTTNTKLWPQRVYVTTDQTQPGSAVEGDFWLSPEV